MFGYVWILIWLSVRIGFSFGFSGFEKELFQARSDRVRYRNFESVPDQYFGYGYYAQLIEK